MADDTVSTQAIVNRFYDQLEQGPHELVLFDINRHAHTRAFLKSDFKQFMDSLWEKPNRQYRLTLITNVGENSPEVLARMREAGDFQISTFLVSPDFWPPRYMVK